MCEEEPAQTGHELARRHKGIGGVRTRLLGICHQQRHHLTPLADRLYVLNRKAHIGMSLHPVSHPMSSSPAPQGLRANETKEKCFILWGNKMARQQMNLDEQCAEVTGPVHLKVVPLT